MRPVPLPLTLIGLALGLICAASWVLVAWAALMVLAR